MKKYEDEVKIGKIIFAAIVICILLVSATDIFKEINDSYLAQAKEVNYWVYPIICIESLIAAVVENIYLVGIYAAFLLASRSVHRTKLDETDFEKNKKIYRDTVKEYSVSVLNYIDNFKLDYKQSYTAKLLELQKNNIIKIDGKKIELIGDPVEEVDKWFVSSIKDNKVTIPISEYEKLVEQEAIEKELITPANFFGTLKDKKMRITMIVISLVALALAILIAFLQDTDFISKIFLASVLSIVVINFIIFFLVAYFFIYIFKLSSEKRYMRTEKGKIINEQLDGLKLFMEKFSNLDSKEAKHLALWDDYLIYSVMFNINKKIQDDYSKFFKNN